MASTRDGFAAYLQAAMNAAGLPMAKDVEEATNRVAKSTTIYRWLRGEGEGELSAKILRAVAGVLHVPVLEMFVAAGLLTPMEAGLEADPNPPEPQTTEDRIRADPRIREDRKEALIHLLETLTEEHTGRAPTHQRRTPVPPDQGVDMDVNEEQSG